MEKFAIRLYSLKFNTLIEMNYSEEVSQVIFDFISIFNANINDDNHSINIDYQHKYTYELNQNIENFVQQYKNILPKIQQTNKYFKQLDHNEYFFVLHPNLELNTKVRLKLETELGKLNGIKEYTDDEKVLLEQFNCILENYELISFDLNKERITPIGIRQQAKRVCRFCKKSKPDVSFDNVAHAISEALGNKKLLLNEECDDCNEFFDENVERDFINYHNLARTMFGIKNKKNKTPQMKGDNFHFFKDEEDNNLSIIITQEEEIENKEAVKNVVFKTGDNIRMQNLYKALCKFSLSVIDSKYIENFNDTIEWLKDEKKSEKLPKIALLHDYHFFTKIPEITLFLRNNQNMDIPYLVGEFKFAFYVYIFIVPFSNQDENEFLEEQEYNEFLECFEHIKNIDKFKFIDMSDNIERKLRFNINFEQRTN